MDNDTLRLIEAAARERAKIDRKNLKRVIEKRPKESGLAGNTNPCKISMPEKIKRKKDE